MNQVHRFEKALGATIVALAFAAPAAAQQMKMMTGPQGGSWYPLGGAIQNIIEKAIPGTSMQVLPGAGISNVIGVQTGKADLGFGNGVSSVDGVNGVEPFKQKTANVCQVATLYFQYFHAVALADAGIKVLSDAKGKALTTQQKGNTGEQMTRDALKVYGLDYGKMSKVNFGSYTDSVSQLKDGHAQVFTLITTVPASAVMDLASARDIRVLEFPDDKFKALQQVNKGYDKRIIKAGSYPKQDKDVQTIGTWTHLIASCKLPEDLVYKITKALASNVENLGNVVSAVKGLSVKDMASDIGVPYHPGALKFYKEAKAM
ncbi:MAG: C4-dicarboxylate ABC transporter substrate-binding protein [Betaproteobacteria bacterium RIFCSPLOWO2_12_FULL_62_58]|nr:MAG: C4-dicarboxylate ABC transporter substrate-binding protein [Betaproteobacteria bacterium RIFCSPLOWO2_02_FULL_62_79]OGA51357.1 MAG: C4-dicarboxylate ABC transporter substrate-binding protein [Betaproteobacteria bacterium RIFCSPLOWO2_12_FULL_62_58]